MIKAIGVEISLTDEQMTKYETFLDTLRMPGVIGPVKSFDTFIDRKARMLIAVAIDK